MEREAPAAKSATIAVNDNPRSDQGCHKKSSKGGKIGSGVLLYLIENCMANDDGGRCWRSGSLEGTEFRNPLLSTTTFNDFT